ncbi:MAG TPA: energy transducer TonB [Pyrinomonadaceae bacterium]|nr:energy transducer TonB [Pyrinomonadaceae bacterium]
MRPSFSLLILCLNLLITQVPNLGWTQDRRVPVAVLGFGDSEIGSLSSETLAQNLESEPRIQILDRDQATAAAKGAGHTISLNMSLEEARGLGAALGSDYFIVGDSQTLRRSPSAGPIYFESYASIFLVSARSGRLLMWRRPSFKASTASAAEKQLLDDLSSHASRSQTLNSIRQAQVDERAKREIAVQKGVPLIESAPDDDKTANEEGLRLPRPFRRLTPAYPETAASAEVEAVVDVLVDLDSKGEVSNVEVSRWAGFGLDESTIDTVRQLHFFPAMRNGTPIPLRVLLRYNFRKPPK